MIVVLLGALALVPLRSVEAGTYIFGAAVTHPSGYTGAGEVLTVTVCVDPASPNASPLRVPVRNGLSTFNALSARSPNLFSGGANDIPSSAIDVESILVHELGHCFGLGHPNVGLEADVGSGDRDYTKSERGPNGMWNLDDGVDGIKGSCDDLRGDDVNLHWFHRQGNNPFVLPSVVDSTTYSRNLAHLPASPAQCSGPGGPGLPGAAGSGPHSFAANAERAVGARLGFPNTEAVMEQGASFDEDQRSLVADDVATVRFAMSGADELASTADDYTFQLVWGGLATSGCDVVVRFNNATAFADCSVSGALVPSQSGLHVAISTGSVRLNTGFNWYFDQDLACSLDVDGNGTVAPLTDGVLALRFLSGMSGSALVSGAIGAGATRSTPQAVAAFLESCRFPLLDADGTGSTGASSDGALALRYLFGFRGSSLVSGVVVGGSCSRCTAPEIERVLGSLHPGA